MGIGCVKHHRREPVDVRSRPFSAGKRRSAIGPVTPWERVEVEAD